MARSELKGASYFAGTVAFIGASFFSAENLHFPTSSHENINPYRQELSSSGVWGFAHNGADIPELLPYNLETRAKSIEADVLWENGRLDIGHNLGFPSQTTGFWNERTTNYFDSAIKAITDSGKDVHFDIKFNTKPDSQAAISMRQVIAQIRKDRTITISGKNWELVNSIRAARENSIGLFSVQKNKDFVKLFSFLEKNNLQGDIGVSIKEDMVDEELVEQLKEKGLLVVVWGVDSPKRAVELVRLGVAGITTDNPAILNALGNR